jgi:hypothetical protein
MQIRYPVLFSSKFFFDIISVKGAGLSGSAVIPNIEFPLSRGLDLVSTRAKVLPIIEKATIRVGEKRNFY